MNQFASMVNTQTAASTKTVEVADLPELTQAFLVWYEANEGRPLANANYESINTYLKTGQSKAVRFTRRGVARLVYMGIDFADIEPLIQEGIFRFAHEMVRPSLISGTAKPYDDATEIMLDYFYEQSLIKA